MDTAYKRKIGGIPDKGGKEIENFSELSIQVFNCTVKIRCNLNIANISSTIFFQLSLIETWFWNQTV
jgi:hypothetical protein